MYLSGASSSGDCHVSAGDLGCDPQLLTLHVPVSRRKITLRAVTISWRTPGTGRSFPSRAVGSPCRRAEIPPPPAMCLPQRVIAGTTMQETTSKPLAAAHRVPTMQRCSWQVRRPWKSSARRKARAQGRGVLDPHCSKSTMEAALYPGETIVIAAGHPVLVKFDLGERDSTLFDL